MKKILKFLTGRLFFVVLGIALQVAVLIFMILYLTNYGYYIYALLTLLSTLTIFFVLGKKDNPMYKIAWILPVAIFPLFGWAFYYLTGRKKHTKKRRERIESIAKKAAPFMHQDEAVKTALFDDNMSFARQFEYIKKTSGLPYWQGTQTKYLSPGEQFFDVLCAELKKAKRFIFMEYFIMERGTMWDSILGILAKKVQEGVEVKLIYDDMGCIQTLPTGYEKHLRSLGIEVHVFNVFKPSLDAFMNYRDHRKITVIDGNVGFTGGNNLADEYINAFVKHGHWKDSSIMLKGDAVWNLSLLFLQMWQYDKNQDVDYGKYRPTESYESDGFVMPYGDGPLDDYLTGEACYMNIINHATKYVSITTPYLILDNEMITSLCNAAESGTDITIFTPHIPDKWYVHAVTRYNYKELLRAGVNIYEYTPGFVHAKTIVADDNICVVGTQNFDYRSFYLHFECGTVLYNSTTVADVRKDHLDMIKHCAKITLEECEKVNPFKKFMCFVLNLFAPLM